MLDVDIDAIGATNLGYGQISGVPNTGKNPYWEAVKEFPWEDYPPFAGPEWSNIGWRDLGSGKPSITRHDLCHQYAWAIPDPASLAFVAEHLGDRAVEIGAGTGYWASLLSRMGVDLLCFDVAPPQLDGSNAYHSPRNEEGNLLTGEVRDVFYTIKEGCSRDAGDHPDRSLFLCWPPYDSSMAYKTLCAYTGNRLVYIGEDLGGCTADDSFFAELDTNWHEVATHKLVQWSGIHDWAWVYERGAAESS